jgi:hypothetical protein
MLQSDGNLVLCGTTRPIFHTRTHGRPGTIGFVQDDGNFVLYAPGNRAVWFTGTAR